MILFSIQPYIWVLTWPNPGVRSCSLCIKCDTKVKKVVVCSLFALLYLFFTLMLSPCLILTNVDETVFISISWREWIVPFCLFNELTNSNAELKIHIVSLTSAPQFSFTWVGMNTARIYEYFANFRILVHRLTLVGLHVKFCHLGSNQILLFKISCITTSSFSTVQAGCVEAGKIIEEDYNHSHGISTRITEGMNYSLYRLSHGIITYLPGFWQLC